MLVYYFARKEKEIFKGEAIKTHVFDKSVRF
jgi:hypothetical protein